MGNLNNASDLIVSTLSAFTTCGSESSQGSEFAASRNSKHLGQSSSSRGEAGGLIRSVSTPPAVVLPSSLRRRPNMTDERPAQTTTEKKGAWAVSYFQAEVRRRRR
ncbi:hypothetical protein Y032_0011g1428 [Ancylostoma ceylanicum]|uniref:Uncharacterized protein n=1 Tax=Ancylostoma ceylanicum TaxID=53326 RepID=A0A016VDW6_9BILA|nr:hypothetical protein Y032_0011g1428 [Ancylostoma ceylanicum]